MLYWTTQQHSEDRKITKLDFGKIFSKVWPQAASPANVACFKVTGIFPYNPNIIPAEAFAPSEINYRVEDNAVTVTTITPPEDDAAIVTVRSEDDAATTTATSTKRLPESQAST
ncbi:hypothetical protein PR048_022079 [Dryococelus australis]|uniref:Uncharacterized protein n=1 Tax=Dryococelus australis TaxID=614101 RepID=A0ABQ9H004_9NEOP|nr:hypothetical protein PR048_022079 [Dryococelus australis]